MTVIQALHPSSQLAQYPVPSNCIHPDVPDPWSLELLEDLGPFRRVLTEEFRLRCGSIGSFGRLSRERLECCGSHLENL
jgi:hypothetical protein